MIGALIAFRIVYFFVPLGFGLTLLLLSERRFFKEAGAREKGSAATGSRKIA